MGRCRKWRQPFDPMPAAREVWALAYPGERWPVGWSVEWAGFMRGVAGLTLYGPRRILLSYGDAKRANGKVVETLLHEFIHVRWHNLRHGADFLRLINSVRARLGFDPSTPRQEWASRGAL